MTELTDHLALGLSSALTLKSLGLCFVGCMIDSLIGVLPGIGLIATIAALPSVPNRRNTVFQE